MRLTGNFILLACVLFVQACGPKFSSDAQGVQHGKNNSKLVRPKNGIDVNRLIDSLKMDRNRIHLEVKKSNYSMKIFYDTTLLKSYPVVFGFNPIDDKLKKGDGCTPEGKFAIRSKYPHGSWSKFIWIDYPNKDSWKKHNQAIKEGKIPKNIGIGGEVGIHGVPTGYDFIIDEQENWTLGCVSLKTADINEVYKALGPKSYVYISK